MATKKMSPQTVCDSMWHELRCLRDSPPLNDQDLYEDHVAYDSVRHVSSILGSISDLPREPFIMFISILVDGALLDEVVELFKGSRRHPALQHASLLALHGAAELVDKREMLISRQDVVGELLHVLASPRRHRITPAASIPYFVNSAASALSTVTGLFTSNSPGLEPRYARVWIDLGALPSLSSSLESHSEFDPSEAVTAEIPLMFFTVATSLLAAAAQSSCSIPDADKLRLSVAILTLLADRTEWIAGTGGGTIAALFSRAKWLGTVANRVPEALKKRAVDAARRCELAGGAWKPGEANEIALALASGDATLRDELYGKACSAPGCGNVQKHQQRQSACDGAAGAEAGDSGGSGAGGGGAFKRCSRCRTMVYCSRDCQLAHWKAGHKRKCVSR
ncbi:unnamed protein product [Sphacelaria rigidula]